MRLVPIIAVCVCGFTGSPVAVSQQPTVDIHKLEAQIEVVLDDVRNCTVGVAGSGSGVVVSKDGLVLTCAHVARESGRKIQISFPDGTIVPATTLGNYRTADAGLIRIDKPGEYPFAKMAKTEDVKAGDWVLAVGYPVTFSKRAAPPVRIGRVLRSFRNSLISDAPIMGGDSGGPLFNLNGEVIGISSRVSSNIASNVHVPIDQFHRNWERLLASEDWPERNSGQSSGRPQRPGNSQPKQEQTTDPFRALGIGLSETNKGVKISSLTVGSQAERMGLRTGHLLLKIGEAEVRDIQSSRTELNKHVGKHDKVSITVTHDDAAHSKVNFSLKLQGK